MRMVMVLLFLAMGLSFSLGATEVPEFKGPVTDHVGRLSAPEEESLHRILRTLEQDTGVELLFLVVFEDGIDGTYPMIVSKRWGVGKKSKNGGLLVIIFFKEWYPVEVGAYGGGGLLSQEQLTETVREARILLQRQDGTFSQRLKKVVNQFDMLVRQHQPLPWYLLTKEGHLRFTPRLLGLLLLVLVTGGWVISWFLPTKRWLHPSVTGKDPPSISLTCPDKQIAAE